MTTAIHLSRRLFFRRAIITAAICLCALVISALSAFRSGETGPILMLLGVIALSARAAYCLFRIDLSGVITADRQRIIIRRFILDNFCINWQGLIGIINENDIYSIYYMPYPGSLPEKIRVPPLDYDQEQIFIDLISRHINKPFTGKTALNMENNSIISDTEVDNSTKLCLMPKRIGIADFSLTGMAILMWFIFISGLLGQLKSQSLIPVLILIPFLLIFSFLSFVLWRDHWRDPGGPEWLFNEDGIRLRFYGSSNSVRWAWNDIQNLKLIRKDAQSETVLPDLEIYGRAIRPLTLKPRSPAEIFQIESVCHHYRPDLKLN